MSSKQILDARGLSKSISELAKGIISKHDDLQQVVIVGIRTRGAILAERLVKKIKSLSKESLPLGILDITLYRDDLSTVGNQPIVRTTEMDFDINGKTMILVDDVLFTGRTVRAALNAIIDYGRPTGIELMVLVDRGHRELPIEAQHVGITLETDLHKDNVKVRLKEVDDIDEVVVKRR